MATSHLNIFAKRLIQFAEDAITASALAHEQDIRGDGDALRFVTRLPASAQPIAPTAEAPVPVAPATPTLVVEASSDSAAESTVESAQSVATRAGDDAVTHVLLGHRAWPLSETRIEIGGADGLDAARLPMHLGTLEQRTDGWHLTPAIPGPALPAMAPGEARVLGPAHTLVTLIRVERD